jgi:hypothetical protein
MKESQLRQNSEEFGVKLAKAVRQRALEAAGEHQLDARYVMRGAAEYLSKTAESQINPPLDPAQTREDRREN